MSDEMRAVAMGVHVLDVLVRPVEAIPEGQGGELVEQIRITAAGSAGGTALTLAKLGADVRSAGAIGTDAVGDMLLALLERDGIDTSLLVRRDDVQTSASVLPIRADGSRPGLPRRRRQRDLRPRRRAVGRARRRHPPAPRRAGVHGRRGRGGDPRARPRARGSSPRPTCSPPASRACSSGSRRRSRTLDYFLPNDDQVPGFTGDGRSRGRLPGAARARRGLRRRDLRRRRRRCSSTPRARCACRRSTIEVVDTTGCGDAFSAGFLRGLSLGREPAEAAAARQRGRRARRAGPRLRPRRLRPRRGRRARGDLSRPHARTRRAVSIWRNPTERRPHDRDRDHHPDDPVRRPSTRRSASCSPPAMARSLTGLYMQDGRHPVWPAPTGSATTSRSPSCAAQLDEYFTGARREFDLPLAPRGSEFQGACGTPCARSPTARPSPTASSPSASAGPGSARAVGAANGRNPIAVVVPCHRVIGASGSSPATRAGSSASACCSTSSRAVVAGR